MTGLQPCIGAWGRPCGFFSMARRQQFPSGDSFVGTPLTAWNRRLSARVTDMFKQRPLGNRKWIEVCGEFFRTLKRPMAFNPENHPLTVSRDRFAPIACTFLLASPVLVVEFARTCVLAPSWNPGREPGGWKPGGFRSRESISRRATAT